MKELSVQEKAKAYDEAIEYAYYLISERCKEGTEGSFHRSDLQKMFPTLAEGEDERIRKELLNAFQEAEDSLYMVLTPNRRKSFIAWLEKQSEVSDKIVERARTEKQRVLVTESDGVANIDWNTRGLQDAKFLIEYGLNYINKKIEKQSKQKFVDKIKPKFNVGDIVRHKNNPHLTYILKRFTDYGDYEFHAIVKDGNEGCTCFSAVEHQDEWELVEQKVAWKPSGEQMEAVKDAIEFLGCTKKVREDLKSLYEQLKKLKG